MPGRWFNHMRVCLEKAGVQAPGHDPYPAPEVFSEAGILAIISDPDRDFIVAECDGEIAGGMIVTHNSPYHREFGCVSIRKNFQGNGLSTLMLTYQKKWEQQCSLVINTTEIVTHSMLSQAAHHKAGYDKNRGLRLLSISPSLFRARTRVMLVD